MKKRFHEGEEVVCVDRNMFQNSFTGLNAPDLPYKSKQTIGTYELFKDGKWWVTVVGGMPGSIYSEDSFEIEWVFQSVNELFELIELGENIKSLKK